MITVVEGGVWEEETSEALVSSEVAGSEEKRPKDSEEEGEELSDGTRSRGDYSLVNCLRLKSRKGTT